MTRQETTHIKTHTHTHTLVIFHARTNRACSLQDVFAVSECVFRLLIFWWQDLLVFATLLAFLCLILTTIRFKSVKSKNKKRMIPYIINCTLWIQSLFYVLYYLHFIIVYTFQLTSYRNVYITWVTWMQQKYTCIIYTGCPKLLKSLSTQNLD